MAQKRSDSFISESSWLCWRAGDAGWPRERREEGYAQQIDGVLREAVGGAEGRVVQVDGDEQI